MSKAKYRLKRLSDYSDESILSELKRVSLIIPAGSITRALFGQHSRVSPSTIIRRFGGWKNALEAAGLQQRYSGQEISDRMRAQSRRKPSRQDVLEELKRVAAKLGHNDITVDEFNAHASFGVTVVRSYFKHWWRALEAAGLTPRATSMRYTDEECYENLLRVWTRFGRAPKYLEMNLPPSKVGGKAYMQRWGTWVKALEAFAARANADGERGADLDNPSSVLIESKREPPACLEEKHLPIGLRYRILVRDRFKCVLCGNSPARDQSVILHVDHVVPLSKGGHSVAENLRTLCNLCNVGKGNLMIE